MRDRRHCRRRPRALFFIATAGRSRNARISQLRRALRGVHEAHATICAFLVLRRRRVTSLLNCFIIGPGGIAACAWNNLRIGTPDSRPDTYNRQRNRLGVSQPYLASWSVAAAGHSSTRIEVREAVARLGPTALPLGVRSIDKWHSSFAAAALASLGLSRLPRCSRRTPEESRGCPSCRYRRQRGGSPRRIEALPWLVGRI